MGGGGLTFKAVLTLHGFSYLTQILLEYVYKKNTVTLYLKPLLHNAFSRHSYCTL